MYLIKRTKAAIAVLNTPDITDSKDDRPLQQSSGQSAKIYFEMKFTTDTHTSYSTSKCKLLTDVKESLSTMQSGTCFQTSDLVLPEKKFQTKLGSLVFPEVSVNVFSSLSPISDTVQSSSERCKHTGFLYVQQNYDKVEKELPSFEIIGDNIDLMKHPSHMTKEKQRQSIHWFLNLAVQRRVISSLPNDKPLAEISSVPNHIFLPSSNDCKNLDAFFRFHIANVHVKHIKCLKPFKKSVPNFIDHRYVKEISQKSQFCVLDLLNKSENKMEEMISILQHIHENYISHTDDNPPSVIRKKKFLEEMCRPMRGRTPLNWPCQMDRVVTSDSLELYIDLRVYTEL